MLTLSGVKAGNIILDLVIRSARETTSADVRELYDLDENSERVATLLESTQEKRFQILELRQIATRRPGVADHVCRTTC